MEHEAILTLLGPDAYPFLLPRASSSQHRLRLDTITQWYLDRARDIDAECGLLTNSLALIELGLKKKVPGVLGGI